MEVLNLDNPLQSMSYQVLQIVIDAYEEGDMAKAEQYAKTISSMLYSDPAAKDKFWQDSASALCTALILGLCEKNIPDNKDKITMYTVANTLNELAAEQEDDGSGKMVTGLDKFFDSLPENHAAKLQYSTVKFASGAGQTVAGIFANAFDKLNIFTLTPIAKMTSQNSFDMKKVGFGKSVLGRITPLSRIHMTFPDGEVSVRSDENGRFSIPHDKSLQKDAEISMRVEPEAKKNKKKKQQEEQEKKVPAEPLFLKVKVTQIEEDTGEVSFVEVERQNDKEGNAITIEKIEHFDKPIALFMIVPDYDSSLHVIASLYVKQLYTELARAASASKGGKCNREVIFILDEFGNMPAIQDMGSIITVCLGRKIRFNLVVQSYSQLEKVYDKEWKTIFDNCANLLYILTTSHDTAEDISKRMGERTIASQSRSGGTLSMKKNKTEGTEGRRLLTPAELLQLEEGEMVVIRGIKRQDNERKKIKAYPIYNKGKTRMKYRYEYLADQFDNSVSINDIDIECEHADVNLKELVYHFHESEAKKAKAAIESADSTEPETESEEKKEATEESELESLEAIPYRNLSAKEKLSDHAAYVMAFKKGTEQDFCTEEAFSELSVQELLEFTEQLNEQEVLPKTALLSLKETINREEGYYNAELQKGEVEDAKQTG